MVATPSYSSNTFRQLFELFPILSIPLDSVLIHHLFLPLINPPSPQRQPLQPQHPRPYNPNERQHPNNHTAHIRNIITIPTRHAHPAAVCADVFLGLEGAAEGLLQRCGGGVFGRFEVRGECVLRVRGRVAGCGSEEVDEFEDEEAREGAA